GTVYLGNVFAGGQSAPGGTRDARNNVEQVRLASPAPGPWTVRVDAPAVNLAAQGFALVISGDVHEGPAGLAVGLASPSPALAAPGEPLNGDVAINPGDDALVPGSAVLAYQYAPGDEEYTIVPLAHVEGTLYRATIPGAYCGESLRFYAAAEGVSSGVRTSPAGAPTNVYTVHIGVAE